MIATNPKLFLETAWLRFVSDALKSNEDWEDFPKNLNAFDGFSYDVEIVELDGDVFNDKTFSCCFALFSHFFLCLINVVKIISIIIATLAPLPTAINKISSWDFPSIDTFGTRKREDD